MRLRQGVDYTIETLTHLKNELASIVIGDLYDTRDNWMRWWSAADLQLRSLFTDDDMVTSLYVTQEKIRGLHPTGLPSFLMGRECDVWRARFEDAISRLEALKPFIGAPGQIVVPDTSAFIEGEYFTDFDWHSLEGITAGELVRLVVPILVIEELDDLKRDRRAGDRARSVLRRLWELGGLGRRVIVPGRNATIEVFPDDPWHLRRPVNDEEIIERAAAIKELTARDVVLAAGDYAMLSRAGAVELKAALMPRPAQATVRA